MNLWRLSTMDLSELLRRLRAGESRNAISRALHMSINTVRAYANWAESHNLLTGPLPDLADLETLRTNTYQTGRRRGRHPNSSGLEAYRAEAATLHEQGRGPGAIRGLLNQHHPGLNASRSAVWRLVESIRTNQPPPPVVGRIETEPGEVAQVDFGFIGYLRDPATGERRKAWVFVMLLAWSRHMYAEFTFDQKLVTWLLGHQRAFEYFGGVPHRVVLDNLKTAIIRAYARDQDASVQQSYRECAEHYGFLIDPCLPRKPQHKGKVERGGVGYIKQSFIPLLEGEPELPAANRQLWDWLQHTAGTRIHGTTRAVPLERFSQVERPALRPLPPTAYAPAIWKASRLPRDGHVIFEQAYYSAPHRLLGQTLWLRAGLQEIRLFTERFELVATHPRAATPGQRLTQPDHLPPNQAQALTWSRPTCQARANAIGPATAQVVAELLADRPVDRLRSALRVLRLAEDFSPARLEAACALGLAQGDTQCATLRRWLQAGRDQQPLPPPTPPPAGDLIFARTPEELAHNILGGAAWN